MNCPSCRSYVTDIKMVALVAAATDMLKKVAPAHPQNAMVKALCINGLCQ